MNTQTKEKVHLDHCEFCTEEKECKFVEWEDEEDHYPTPSPYSFIPQQHKASICKMCEFNHLS